MFSIHLKRLFIPVLPGRIQPEWRRIRAALLKNEGAVASLSFNQAIFVTPRICFSGLPQKAFQDFFVNLFERFVVLLFTSAKLKNIL